MTAGAGIGLTPPQVQGHHRVSASHIQNLAGEEPGLPTPGSQTPASVWRWRWAWALGSVVPVKPSPPPVPGGPPGGDEDPTCITCSAVSGMTVTCGTRLPAGATPLPSPAEHVSQAAGRVEGGLAADPVLTWGLVERSSPHRPRAQRMLQASIPLQPCSGIPLPRPAPNPPSPTRRTCWFRYEFRHAPPTQLWQPSPRPPGSARPRSASALWAPGLAPGGSPGTGVPL